MQFDVGICTLVDPEIPRMEAVWRYDSRAG